MDKYTNCLKCGKKKSVFLLWSGRDECYLCLECGNKFIIKQEVKNK